MADDKVQCPRCAGRREVVCPSCRGTGDARNDSWVVIGPCKACARSPRKGFITCPKCGGTGLVSPVEAPPPDSKKQ